MKVETYNIASFVASLTGRAMILVLMYVQILRPGVIVFISDIKMGLTSQ